MPRPDFPRTLRDFQARFADETAGRLYLAESRWPDGYRFRFYRRNTPMAAFQILLGLGTQQSPTTYNML